MANNESIDIEDMNLLFLTDSVEEMTAHIKTHAIKKFGLTKKRYNAKWWFGEKLTL